MACLDDFTAFGRCFIFEIATEDMDPDALRPALTLRLSNDPHDADATRIRSWRPSVSFASSNCVSGAGVTLTSDVAHCHEISSPTRIASRLQLVRMYSLPLTHTLPCDGWAGFVSGLLCGLGL